MGVKESVMMTDKQRMKYMAFLQAFEAKYFRMARAPDRFEAYRCAISGTLPYWYFA